MPETLQPFGEQEPRPVWKDLIEIEKLIANEMKKIDASGPDFLARQEFLEKLRKRYNWYEKWASSTQKDRLIWAEEFIKELGRDEDKIFELADENYETALGVYAPGGIDNTLNKIQNATIEDLMQVLERIKASVSNAEVDIKDVVRKLLAYLLEFRRQMIYLDLTDEERDYLRENVEMIESSIDDREFLFYILPIFIDKFVDILKTKKKPKGE